MNHERMSELIGRLESGKATAHVAKELRSILFEPKARVGCNKISIKMERVKQAAPKINGPSDVFSIFKSLIGDLDREHIYALHLDAHGYAIGYELIAIGQFDGCKVSPREVFRSAILSGAHSLILVHNHPSGDPTQSKADIEMAKAMFDAGAVLGYELLDSIVVGDTWSSAADTLKQEAEKWKKKEY